ncbi:MAG: hypothetical protein OQK61_08740 [Ignavibacteriaceae bacterium]|nr:hypothetical protein [Ignavibacteriaceae bacterium]
MKREDLNHTGAHKINNTIGQALLARRMGKTRIIAETGAGQHGVASATVDIYAAVTALQPCHRYTQPDISIRDRCFGIPEGHGCVNPSCAADRKFTFLFGIQVHQNLSLEQTGFETESSGHAALLIARKERFERTMPHGG